MADTSELLERIVVAEQKIEREENSTLKKISAYGALIALFISLVTSGYTLYDNFFERPAKERIELLSEVRDIVSRITTINWELAEIYLQNDPRRIQTVSQVANGEKMALLGRAHQIIENEKINVTFPEYLVLSYELLAFGRTDEAIRYAKRAEESAPNSQFRAEAIRYRARALFAAGPTQDVSEARNSFTRALEEAKAAPDFSAVQIIGNVYTDFILNELHFGDCDQVEKIFTTMNEELGKLKANYGMLNAIKGNIQQQLNSQARCQVALQF